MSHPQLLLAMVLTPGGGCSAAPFMVLRELLESSMHLKIR
jgi:hypothetical protein